jgi:molybdate transport system substrate-binding protein
MASSTAGKTLRVLSSNGVHAALLDLGPQFERANGCRLDVSFDTANGVADRINRGERGDVAIVTAPVMQALARDGITLAARALARSGAGIAVRAGAPKPDIETVDAFKAALLASKSIVYTRLGASGIYFAGLIDRLGIGAEIRAKATIPDGGLVGEYVAAGKVEMAVQQIPELVVVPGVAIVGPFPRAVQVYTVMAAAPFSEAPHATLAKALVEFLASPAALGVYRDKGMEAADQGNS